MKRLQIRILHRKIHGIKKKNTIFHMTLKLKNFERLINEAYFDLNSLIFAWIVFDHLYIQHNNFMYSSIIF